MAVHAISQQDLKFSFLHNVYTHTLFAVFCMHMHVRITVVPRGVPYKSYLHFDGQVPVYPSRRVVLVSSWIAVFCVLESFNAVPFRTPES